MSVLDISRMSPRARDVFMEAEAAILAWDVDAYKRLDDCLKNNKRVWDDVDHDKVLGEKFAGTVIALILDAMPAYVLYSEALSGKPEFSVIYVLAGIIITVTAVIALHRRSRIKTLRKHGAIWKQKINALIDAAKSLNREELRELYAAMYTVGLDVKQSKRVASAAYNIGWWDGYFVAGD